MRISAPRKYKLVSQNPGQHFTRSFSSEESLRAAYNAAKNAGYVLEMFQQVEDEWVRIDE